MKKKITVAIFAVCLISTFLISAQEKKEKKIQKEPELSEPDENIDTSNMQKDFEELMKLYKELKVKAMEFQKKYKGMLPPELMPLVMRQHGQMMEKDGNQKPIDGKQKPEHDGAKRKIHKNQEQEKDIFE